METLSIVIGFIMGLSTFVADIMPTWLLAILVFVAAALASASYTSIYPIHRNVDYVHKPISFSTLFFAVVLYVLADALFLQYGIDLELSWMSVAYILAVGLSASFFTWLYVNYKHVVTVRAVIFRGTQRGASNLNELTSMNLIYVQNILDTFCDSKFKEFTKMKDIYTWGASGKLCKLHLDHRNLIENKVSIDSCPAPTGPKGQRAETQSMFATPTSHWYPKYDRKDEVTSLEEAWLYCLHTNTVQKELIDLLRKYLVLDASYFKGTVFYIIFCWPVVLVRFILGDFILRLKDYFFRVSARLMNAVSQAFTSRM